MTRLPRYHFNWDKLMAGRDVDDFLASDALWGENQEIDAPSRTLWRAFLGERLASAGALRLLEIGFGSGIDYRGLEQAGLLESPGLVYVGADVTRAFTEHARAHFTALLPVLIGGYTLPFADGAFDVVYLRHILEHQVHYRALMKEVFRVCAGSVFVTFFMPLAEAAEDDIRFDGTWYHNRYARADFLAFCRDHGFEVRELALYRHARGYEADQILVCERR